jgi:RNA polymerase sigma-70 factor (ECF subfamily)
LIFASGRFLGFGPMKGACLRRLSIMMSKAMGELRRAEAEQESLLPQLIDGHLPALLEYLARRSPSPEAAEDLAAETLAVACRKWSRIRPERPRLWLLAIARRLAADAWRKRRRQAIREARKVSEAAPEDDSLALRLAVLALPLAQREALLLTSVEGYSAEEAGRIMERSPGAVNSLVQRARETLKRSFLEDH